MRLTNHAADSNRRRIDPVHQPDGLFEATVGNALFAHRVVTLDFHAMKIYVHPG